GVAVPNRADPWTRKSYAGSNQPIAPNSDPYALFEKLYGRMKDRENLGSILDDVREDLDSISRQVDPTERDLLDKHATFVREMERDVQNPSTTNLILERKSVV